MSRESDIPPGTAQDSPAEATPEDSTPPTFAGPIHERSKLSGDWLGCRTGLSDCGITFDLSTTQFYQGVATGGLEQAFQYGGRNDYFLNLDGEKLGLWQRAIRHAARRNPVR